MRFPYIELVGKAGGTQRIMIPEYLDFTVVILEFGFGFWIGEDPGCGYV